MKWAEALTVKPGQKVRVRGAGATAMVAEFVIALPKERNRPAPMIRVTRNGETSDVALARVSKVRDWGEKEAQGA